MKKFIFLIFFIITPFIYAADNNIFNDLSETIGENVDVNGDTDVNINTSNGHSSTQYADVNVTGGANGSVGIDLSCDSFKVDFSLDNYLTPFQDILSDMTNLAKTKLMDEIINAALTVPAAVMCLINQNDVVDGAVLNEFISAATDAAQKIIKGMLSHTNNLISSGKPMMFRTLIYDSVVDTFKDRFSGEKFKVSAQTLSECINKQIPELRKMIDSLSNKSIEFNMDANLAAKEECILDKNYDTHDVGGALSSILGGDNENFKGFNAQDGKDKYYCFVDGTCASMNNGEVELKSISPNGFSAPTGTEYQNIVQNSIKTWLSRAETMNINPIAFATIGNTLNELYNKYINTSEVNGDFLLDLQSRINYAIDASLACMKSKFITEELPSGETGMYQTKVFADTLGCINNNFFSNKDYIITEKLVIDSYIYSMNKTSSAKGNFNYENYNDGTKIANKNFNEFRDSAIYDIYNFYLSPIFVSVRNYGASYKASTFKLFTDIAESLFIVYDDFYAELMSLESNKMADISHNMNKQILALAQRDNLGLEKKEIIDKLNIQKYSDMVKAKRLEFFRGN